MSDLNEGTTEPFRNHHYFRTLFSSLFGFIAMALIIVSIIVFWLNRTLTDTGQYVKTVAPLVSESDVQNFVVDKASNALIDSQNVPMQVIAAQILGVDQVIGKTDEQLRSDTMQAVKQSFKTAVASPAFATVWTNTNRNIHSNLIAQLGTNTPAIALNFQPIFTGVVDQLGTTKLAFVKDNLRLKTDAGVVILQGKQLDTLRNFYSSLKQAVPVVVGVTILSLLLCVLLSVHHMKTFRRVTLSTGIFTASLAILLGATSLINTGSSDILEQKMVEAIIKAATYNLRISLIIIAVLCIVSSVGSKIYEVVMVRRRVQS